MYLIQNEFSKFQLAFISYVGWYHKSDVLKKELFPAECRGNIQGLGESFSLARASK